MDEKLNKMKALVREFAFIRRLQDENKCEVRVRSDMHFMLVKNETSVHELDRVRRAQKYQKKLHRKMRPANIINGDVIIKKFGPEFVHPDNLVPKEYLDLIAGQLNLSNSYLKKNSVVDTLGEHFRRTVMITSDRMKRRGVSPNIESSTSRQPSLKLGVQHRKLSPDPSIGPSQSVIDQMQNIINLSPN